MRRLFVDSFYYMALINPYDSYHQDVSDIAPQLTGCRFWTTDLVLVEVANALMEAVSLGFAVRQQALCFLLITHDMGPFFS